MARFIRSCCHVILHKSAKGMQAVNLGVRWCLYVRIAGLADI